jgi:hypothetical protein
VALDLLQARLRQVRSGISYRAPKWVTHPLALGYRVILNGRELGRIGVHDPGSLSIDVVVRHRLGSHRAFLSIHGGERVGQCSWRWRKWTFDNRRLEVGDRVRIQVVAPVRLSCGRVQELETREVTDLAGITREVKELQKSLKLDYYRKEATDVIRAERERLPARRYPRS